MFNAIHTRARAHAHALAYAPTPCLHVVPPPSRSNLHYYTCTKLISVGVLACSSEQRTRVPVYFFIITSNIRRKHYFVLRVRPRVYTVTYIRAVYMYTYKSWTACTSSVHRTFSRQKRDIKVILYAYASVGVYARVSFSVAKRTRLHNNNNSRCTATAHTNYHGNAV